MPDIFSLMAIEERRSLEVSAAIRRAVKKAILEHGLDRVKVMAALNKTLQPVLGDAVTFNLRLGTKWLDQGIKEAGSASGKS